MALILCPECGQQVSDQTPACPHCGFPISSYAKKEVRNYAAAKKAKGKKTSKWMILLAVVLWLVAALVARNAYRTFFAHQDPQEKAHQEASELYKRGDYLAAMEQLELLGDYSNAPELIRSCKYNLAVEAMDAGGWKEADDYLRGLNYENSEKMRVDCAFMMALEESILYHLDTVAKGSWDERDLISAELAYLTGFRNREFYDVVLGIYADSYISGLETQLESLGYERPSAVQAGWYAGMVTKCMVLDVLYQEFGFMAGNMDFVGAFVNQREYYEGWLDAMNAMEVNGHKRAKDAEGNDTYVELYLKNDTMYTSTQTFEVTFWKDEEGKQLLGTSSATVENIRPYEAYTVRVYVPVTVQNETYYYSWTNYYEDILIN